MTSNWIRILGAIVAVVGLVFSWLFKQDVQFNINPEVWFSASYYVQFIPLYIAVSLLLCGAFVATRFRGVNFYLAVFGHSTSEEILFSLIGWTTTPLPSYAIVVFLPLSIVAIAIAYTNVLKANRVSVVEAIFGIVFSTAFILLPRFL